MLAGMTKHPVLLLLVVLGGCGARTSNTPIAANVPPVPPSVVAVGDKWDDAVRKLSDAGAKPDDTLALDWITQDGELDMYLNVPKLPERQVWLLNGGVAVKLWGDSPIGLGPQAHQRVSRIEQSATATESGIISRIGDPRDVERVELRRRSDAR